MKRWIILTTLLVLGLTFGAAVALANGGNSDSATACQKDGWRDLKAEVGSEFKSAGDCVSYAARGGQFLAPTTEVAGTLRLAVGGTVSSPSNVGDFFTGDAYVSVAPDGAITFRLGYCAPGASCYNKVAFGFSVADATPQGTAVSYDLLAISGQVLLASFGERWCRVDDRGTGATDGGTLYDVSTAGLGETVRTTGVDHPSGANIICEISSSGTPPGL